VIKVHQSVNFTTEDPLTMNGIPAMRAGFSFYGEDIGRLAGGHGPTWRKLRSALTKSINESMPRQ
jgi:hypothetical protein